jgi:hypothetical protein
MCPLISEFWLIQKANQTKALQQNNSRKNQEGDERGE